MQDPSLNIQTQSSASPYRPHTPEHDNYASPYRPHNPGHDYYAPGIYLITLVVRNRRDNAHLLGTLNNSIEAPAVQHTAIGKAVLECWEEIPAFEESKGRKVRIHIATSMPDHFHGVIEVVERMDVSLGQVIWGFKVACTKRWRQIQAMQQPMTAAEQAMSVSASSDHTGQPSLVAPVAAPTMPSPATMAATPSCAPAPDLHRMSKKQRAAYYAQHPEAQQPLWDDDYDDTICLTDPITGTYCLRHFTAMVNYVNDNARRAIIMHLRPYFMQRSLHVRIKLVDAEGRPLTDAYGRPMVDCNGKPLERDYAAFGNLFLLRWARKVQVMCHRVARRGMLTDEEWQKATTSKDVIERFENNARENKLGGFDPYWYLSSKPNNKTAIDYTRTAAFRTEHDAWVTQVMAGATVIVTPGISRGELLMKDECLDRGYPLIHLQKEPIGPYWKPERTRFEACTHGRLLILAPWKPELLGDVDGVPSDADYSMFHNMNGLAREICMFDGEAVVKGG